MSHSRVLRGLHVTTVRDAALDLDLRRRDPLPSEDAIRARIEAAVQEGRERGRREGQREGKELAAAEARAALKAFSDRASRAIAALTTAVDAMHAAREALLGDADEAVVSGAFELATALVGRELELAVQPGRDALVRALTACAREGSIVVHLNPGDLETLGEVDDLSRLRDTHFVADASISRGDAVVEGEGWSVDARIASGIERARKALWS